MLGLSGKVLQWFRSYLEQHSQRVSVHGIFGIECTTMFSSWSSIFIMHTRSHVIIVQRYCVKYHLYADDIQL